MGGLRARDVFPACPAHKPFSYTPLRAYQRDSLFVLKLEKRIMPTPTDTSDRPARAIRHDGWTAERQRVFFETLAAGHPVAWACVRAGLSRQAAYKARRRDAGFAREWRAALLSARHAEEAAFLRGLPASLRGAVFDTLAPCELHGAPFLPMDSVIPVKPV